MNVPRTERLSGAGELILSASRRTLARGVRYVVTVVAPEAGEHLYRRIEATLDLVAMAVSHIELGERVTLALEDGRYIDLIICGQSDNRVDVIAVSGPRGHIQ
jgi:hypothetical protein